MCVGGSLEVIVLICEVHLILLCSFQVKTGKISEKGFVYATVLFSINKTNKEK